MFTRAAELLAELRVDADVPSVDCGLDPAALTQPDLPVPGPAVAGFFETAAVRSGNDDVGLRLATRRDLSVPGPRWTTMHSAMTVRDALRVLARFFVMHTSGVLIGLKLQAEGGALVSDALSAGVGPRDR